MIHAATKVGPIALAAVLLGIDAGLRMGEIRGLQRGDLDFHAGTVTVHRAVTIRDEVTTPKHGKARTVPMTPRLSDALKALPGHLKVKWLFPLEDGQPITKAKFRTLIKEVERGCGRPDLGKAHVYRHTYGTNLARAGVPARTIMDDDGPRQPGRDRPLHAPGSGQSCRRTRSPGDLPGHPAPEVAAK